MPVPPPIQPTARAASNGALRAKPLRLRPRPLGDAGEDMDGPTPLGRAIGLALCLFSAALMIWLFTVIFG